jgi:Alpha/beta hydrolase domain
VVVSVCTGGAPRGYASERDDKSIHIDRPDTFDAGAIYEFTYTARDPKVMGIGFAAVRDLVTFLKEANTDNRGNSNPLNDLRQAPCELSDPSVQCATRPATTVDVSLIEGISQSGRFTRDFIWQGFNADTRGRRVFDGARRGIREPLDTQKETSASATDRSFRSLAPRPNA